MATEIGAAAEERIGVLLFNLGGPETLADVKPFLFNLFSDPDIIRLPWRPMQKPLAWLISRSRYKKSSGYYAQIGGGSPLRRITDEQARALETALATLGTPARVYVGMRYWHPFLEEALDRIRRDQISRLVVLPLYPQFSLSTTGSSLNRMNSLIAANGQCAPPLSIIRSWHDEPGYIAALSASIAEELDRFSDPDPQRTHVVFSAHSVPVRYIDEGDPYLEQTQETVRSVMAELGGERPHHLAFQSKVGPVKWLRPSTGETIRRLARESAKQVLLVPVSFVSEHIETLYELDILYRNVAREVGIEEYRRVAALNCRTDFISALANMVQQRLRD
ncbi:MAG TPA: ferrochelatase [Blastocatellia bacterium]|nr:ferrochelatase [Blastocatellia bacterium]